MSERFPVELVAAAPTGPEARPTVFLLIVHSFQGAERSGEVTVGFPDPMVVPPFAPRIYTAPVWGGGCYPAI